MTGRSIPANPGLSAEGTGMRRETLDIYDVDPVAGRITVNNWTYRLMEGASKVQVFSCHGIRGGTVRE